MSKPDAQKAKSSFHSSENVVRWWDSVCISTREEIQFPSVLLHPPPLAF